MEYPTLSSLYFTLFIAHDFEKKGFKTEFGMLLDKQIKIEDNYCKIFIDLSQLYPEINVAIKQTVGSLETITDVCQNIVGRADDIWMYFKDFNMTKYHEEVTVLRAYIDLCDGSINEIRFLLDCLEVN